MKSQVSMCDFHCTLNMVLRFDSLMKLSVIKIWPLVTLCMLDLLFVKHNELYADINYGFLLIIKTTVPLGWPFSLEDHIRMINYCSTVIHNQAPWYQCEPQRNTTLTVAHMLFNNGFWDLLWSNDISQMCVRCQNEGLIMGDFVLQNINTPF